MSPTVELAKQESTLYSSGLACHIPRDLHSRMTISTQMLRTWSPLISQQGACTKSAVSLPPWRRGAGLKCSSGFQKGRGCSILAIKQAWPFSSSDEDASDEEVPAKDTSVRNFTGTNTVELMDPTSPAKLVDDQLPPLFSMVIDGLPPFQISKYVDEAEKCLHQYVEHYQNVSSLDSYYRAGLSAAAYGHPGVINVDRLVAISFSYGLQFLIDDLFFDNPDEFLQDQYGISRDARESFPKIQEHLNRLDAIFGLQVQPCNPAPLIETILWEAGQYTLELTNPEWFNHYVACLMEHHHAGVASHVDFVQGRNLCIQDVDSYAIMRAGNVGGKFVQLMVELASDSYIPGILRTNPYLENLTTATSIHLGFVNDVFSYHKESALEQNPRNLISVLMECEGKPFVQIVHMAIDLANTYARTILDLESQAWNSTLQNHIQGIKALIVGNVYFSSMDYRYRHPDSVFPELRDMTSSWKVCSHAKESRL